MVYLNRAWTHHKTDPTFHLLRFGEVSLFAVLLCFTRLRLFFCFGAVHFSCGVALSARHGQCSHSLTTSLFAAPTQVLAATRRRVLDALCKRPLNVEQVCRSIEDE